MKKLTLIGTALALISAFAAISVASASAALPEIYQCGHAARETATYELKGKTKTKLVYTGKYTDKKCSKEAPAGKYRAGGAPEGKYELEPWNVGSKTEKTGKEGKVKAFKGTNKGANLEVKNVGGISCTSSSDTGEFTSPTTGDDIVATFKGCEFNGKKCESGATSGEIVTNKLQGVVGYLKGKGTGSPTVGVAISAETGGILASFQCSHEVSKREQEFEVEGSVISEVTPSPKGVYPVNKFGTEVGFTFKQKAIGVQEWEYFEGSPTQHRLITGICTACRAEGTTPLKEVQAESSEEAVFVNKGEELELKA
jgi:hypothetical protein